MMNIYLIHANMWTSQWNDFNNKIPNCVLLSAIYLQDELYLYEYEGHKYLIQLHFYYKINIIYEFIINEYKIKSNDEII